MRNINLIKAALLVSILSVILLSVGSTIFLFPMYTNYMIESTEEDAIRDSNHLSKIFINEAGRALSEKSIRAEHEQIILEDMKALGVHKLRVFSPSGKIIYSSEKSEIGQVNSKPYFTNLVAKGQSYTKIVNKKTKTREGDISQIDVIESYVPMMRKDVFVGALELYFDVSKKKSSLDLLANRTYWTIFPVSFVLLILIVLVSLKANINFEKLKQAETELQDSYEKIEHKVSQRTKELKVSNIQLQNEIKERKKYEKQMMLSASVFENTIEGIVITDRDAIIQRVNQAFTNITGFSPDEAIGENPRILKSDRHDTQFYKQMWQALKDCGMWEGEIWNRRKNGETYPDWLSINVINDTQGEPINYVGLFHDISELKKNETMLKYQANYDPLTGLPNRQLFNDRLKMAISHNSREDLVLPLGVLFCDLDDFKNINDSLGHYFGDLLLKEVAKRLSECCREEDTVARLGGDDFLIICSFTRQNEPAATSLAQRILNSFEEPFILKKQQIYTQISIGITLFPEDGKDFESLVKNAEVAMYRSKDVGKNRFSFYTTELNREVLRRISLSNDLRGALAREEFIVYYQPKIDIKTGLVSGMEALVRWNRRKTEMVSPVEFIPLAEDTSVIYALGEWVMEEACSRIREFSSLCGRDLKIAVNLSVKQFAQKDLIYRIQEIIQKTGLSSHLLTVEITENIVIKNIDATIHILKLLNALGIRISIDDFGTGYSSLSYLKLMPLSELKIDKSFVDDIPDNLEACAIVKTVLSLAENLNLKTVAEGVETLAQLEFLKKEGCHEIQGYYYCKPISHEEMKTFLTTEKHSLKY